ncbi:MAG: Flp family type IVb pilin [Coriobacteriia bacterium]|nr:Flp family type IVb pilin [Coriobacteriia bacterium]
MFQTLVVRLLTRVKSDEGATAVEYGIMVAAIAAIIVGVVILLGEQIQAAFQAVVDALAAL